MFITIQCQACGYTIMQRDVDMQIVINKNGVWLTVTAYCKACNLNALYKFRAED